MDTGVPNEGLLLSVLVLKVSGWAVDGAGVAAFPYLSVNALPPKQL